MQRIQSKQFKAQQRKLKNVLMDDEEDEDGDQKQALFTITQAQETSHHFVVRLHNQIGPPSEYASLLNLFDNVTENDHVVLDINSPGGVMDSAILIRRAIRSCAAPVTARIGITTASAATVIALACDNFEVDDLSTFHIHTASLGLGFGKVNDLHAAAEHNIRLIDKFVRQAYEHFLSEDELVAVLNGKEMYFGSEELYDRLNRLMEARYAEESQEECDGDCEGCSGECRDMDWQGFSAEQDESDESCQEDWERANEYTLEKRMSVKEEIENR